MLNKKERELIKNQITKAMTDSAHGIFDKETGEAEYSNTNLEMVMQCVFDGLNKITGIDGRTANSLQDALNKADELHFDECVEFEVRIAELKRELLNSKN